MESEGAANFRLNFMIQTMVKYPPVLVNHEWVFGNHWGLRLGSPGWRSHLGAHLHENHIPESKSFH